MEKVSSQPVSYSAFGSGRINSNQKRNVYKFELEGVTGGVHTLRAIEIPVICTPMRRTGVTSNLMNSFGPLRFADSYTENREITIDILIGLNFYWLFMKNGMIRVDGLVAQETVFGWVVSGSWGSGLETSCEDLMPVSPILCCLTDIPEVALQTIWDLESIGIKPGSEIDPEDLVLQKFNETVLYSEEGNRYEVSLPWRETLGQYKRTEPDSGFSPPLCKEKRQLSLPDLL
jgi:hypothetical protein